MNVTGWVVVALGVVVLYTIVTYNKLVGKKMYVKEAWSGIDVQLKRKANIIKNLIDTLQWQTEYESKMLSEVVGLRNGLVEGSQKDRMQANDTLTKMVPSFYAVAENYPQLGAHSGFQKTMSEIVDAEEKISFARRGYNLAVTAYNTAIAMVPASMIAGVFHMHPEPVFELEESARIEADELRIRDLR